MTLPAILNDAQLLVQHVPSIHQINSDVLSKRLVHLSFPGRQIYNKKAHRPNLAKNIYAVLAVSKSSK